VVAYEEKPREQWLFDFPAQVALCGSQIWWTIEVNIAFGRLEEGYENALRDFNKKQVCLYIAMKKNFFSKLPLMVYRLDSSMLSFKC
jgi:dynein heavy chain